MNKEEIYERFINIIETEIKYQYNPLASKIKDIIQRCKNMVDIETNKERII